MSDPKRKRKRNKATIIFLLPALVVIFLVGWCMYFIGDEKRSNKIQRKQPKRDNAPIPQKDNVTIMPIIYEEPQELRNE